MKSPKRYQRHDQRIDRPWRHQRYSLWRLRRSPVEAMLSRPADTKKHAPLLAVVAVLLAWISLPFSTAFGIQFSGLGYLPGGSTESVARGISLDGTVVVGASRNAQGRAEPFRWTSNSGMVGLGYLSGATAGDAYAVSSSGDVVVGSSGLRAFSWSQPTGMVALPNFVSGYQYQANAVSSNGLYAAGFYYPSSGATSIATTWTPGIGTASGQESFGITADGTITVGVRSTPTGFQAFREVSGSSSSLGFLTGTVGNSGANAVTSDGVVVVGYSSSPQGQQAFRWTNATGMIGLGDVGVGSFNSAATALSLDGSVVVGTSSDGYGFVWTADAGMQSLRQMLLSGGVDLSMWSELAPLAVSGDGLIIAGQGRHSNGSTEAFVASVPEPSTCYSLAAALTIGYLGLRRHRTSGAQ
jgi:probable HAF family extracellular repeat protein